MNRRGFLKALLIGGAALATEQLVPDVARTYFLPPAGGCWRPFPSVVDLRGLFNPSADLARQHREGILPPALFDVQREYNRLQSAQADGLALRFIEAYDTADMHKYAARMDLLYGVATVRPGLACRILA